MDSFSNLWGPVREKEWYEEVEDQVCEMFPSLTYTQRLGGCALCMGVGFLISMGSTIRLVSLLHGDPVPFATMYTIGNVLAMSSTCFLFGPYAQAKKMFAETRFITTCVYFSCMATTLFVAFYEGEIPMRGFILILLIICQFLALAWYTLSFIPYGRDMVWGCCRRYLPDMPEVPVLPVSSGISGSILGEENGRSSSTSSWGL